MEKNKFEYNQYADCLLQFGEKWMIFFENPYVDLKYIFSSDFENECKALNFKDAGNIIFQRCGSACCELEQLEKIIDQIDDAEFLGSMLYSNWLYFYKFSCYPEKILLHKNREWFLCILNRMQELAVSGIKNNSPVRKIKVCTESLFYDCIDGVELSQELTLNSQGRVCLKKISIDRKNFNENEREIAKETFYINKDIAVDIMAQCDRYLPKEEICIDSGMWIAEIFREDGIQESAMGPIGKIFMDDGSNLSEYIRCSMGRHDLMMFDKENIDNVIENITLEYNRETKALDKSWKKYSLKPEKWVKPKNNEQLSIDRQSGTVEYSRDKNGQIIEYKFEDKFTMNKLLSFFTRKNLFKMSHEISMGMQRCCREVACNEEGTEKNNTDALEKAYDKSFYTMKITYQDGSDIEFYGNFNRNDLPFEYAGFISVMESVIKFKEKGDIFNPKMYKRGKAMPGEYIYCSVSINHSKNTYYYIADEDDFEIDDLVDVPVGDAGQVLVGKIKDIEFFTEREVPLDIDKTKHIVGKHQNI